MSLKLTGFNSLSKKLSNISSVTDRKTRVVLENGAKKIKQTARDNAPVDEGNLEKAIKYAAERTGVRGRNQYTVYVDDEVSAKGVNNTVGNYAEYMHDHFGYELGEKSQAKADSGKNVGPKYLERAVEEHEENIRKDLEGAIGESMR